MIINVLLFALTAGSSILLAFLLLSNISRVNGVANRWLGAFYFCLACVFCQLFIESAGLLSQATLFVHVMELTRWAMLPCFYLAVLYFVNPAKKSRLVLLHFLPATGFLLFSMIFIIPRLFDPAQDLPVLPPIVPATFRYFFRIQAVVYWLLCFRLLLIHSRNIKLISSSIENINLNWIRYLLIALFAMLIVRLSSGSSGFISQASPLIYFCGVLCTGYFSLTQEVIYPVAVTRVEELGSLLNEKKGHERLSSDQVDQLKDKVAEITKTKKLYLDPSLNLPALSAETGINTHELSYILNTGLNQNFYSFINEMRVEEAKQILLSPKAKQLDMVGIATHAGFNSKTTFNITFKKLTGQTPTEFLKSQSGAGR